MENKENKLVSNFKEEVNFVCRSLEKRQNKTEGNIGYLMILMHKKWRVDKVSDDSREEGEFKFRMKRRRRQRRR